MNFFYKTNVDICSDKQMFKFLKEHFTYFTSKNPRFRSIANNVKVHNLNLSGDYSTALNMLESEDYITVNEMILDWERNHEGYLVRFNGRSGGYLVLLYDTNPFSVLPDTVDICDDYEEYKRYCKEYYGGVKHNRNELREAVKLVQDFDKLCDEIRDYVDELSNTNFIINEMIESVERFNIIYNNDLEMLDFSYLRVEEDGSVDLFEVIRLQSLTEAFLRIAERKKYGYRLRFISDTKVILEEV